MKLDSTGPALCSPTSGWQVGGGLSGQAAVHKSHSHLVPTVSGDYLQSRFQTRSQGPERVSNLLEATQLGGGSAWQAEVYIAPNPLAHLAT